MKTAPGRTWPTSADWHRVDCSGAEPSDAQLLAAARGGSVEALEQLLAPHERRLYLLCRGVLHCSDDAEDAVQETFFRALRALPRFRGETAIRPWLLRIAVNVCLEWKRSRRARPVEPLDDGMDPLLTTFEGDTVDRLLVTEALATVPARARTALVLKELEGWTAAEIAGVLHCTERQVYYELQKAYRMVAEWRRRTEEEA